MMPEKIVIWGYSYSNHRDPWNYRLGKDSGIGQYRYGDGKKWLVVSLATKTARPRQFAGSCVRGCSTCHTTIISIAASSQRAHNGFLDWSLHLV